MPVKLYDFTGRQRQLYFRREKKNSAALNINPLIAGDAKGGHTSLSAFPDFLCLKTGEIAY
jgi:hypothetical protein